ncbi:MAG: glycosyl transferase, family 4 [Polaromonas sp.]|nr:glycosyl transferase, family 4 [Polaromonas sp.]
MVALMVLSFLVSLIAGGFCIRWARGHQARYGADKPQRFHTGDVPRIGGLGILFGTVGGWFLANFSLASESTAFIPELFLISSFVVLPAFAGGMFEDLSQRVPVRYRLVLTGISAALACWLLGLSVPRLDIPLVDIWFVNFPWLGVSLAFLAICGLPHAFNLIDGYNGLAGTVALLICLAIAHVALQLGDRQLAGLVLCLSAGTLGFLAWNYPKGLIFAGDGGAYLWGIVIAVASVMLVQRHQQVSAWFPMLLVIYPTWETFFSIYRKMARGVSPSVADALHFHQLIFRRIVRGVFHDDASRRMLMRNNRTSPYLWGFTLMTIVPAVLFWRNSLVLMFFCFLFALSYVTAYVAIVRFKVPGWLRR